MSIDQMLAEFLLSLEKEYGVKNPITKISFSHEAFDRIMYDLSSKSNYRIRYSDINDCNLLGVRIEARAKEEKNER